MCSWYFRVGVQQRLSDGNTINPALQQFFLNQQLEVRLSSCFEAGGIFSRGERLLFCCLFPSSTRRRQRIIIRLLFELRVPRSPVPIASACSGLTHATFSALLHAVHRQPRTNGQPSPNLHATTQSYPPGTRRPRPPAIMDLTRRTTLYPSKSSCAKMFGSGTFGDASARSTHPSETLKALRKNVLGRPLAANLMLARRHSMRAYRNN